MVSVNVTSVQIIETLTLFFCSWGVFISAALSHPAQEELASATLFSFVKQIIAKARTGSKDQGTCNIYQLHP